MTTSPEPVLLRGAAATAAAPARLDGELHVSRFPNGVPSDGRLADPRLHEAFAELAREVRAAAQAEGYAAGWAAGHAAATTEVKHAAAREHQFHAAQREAERAAVTAALQALATAADDLEARAVAPAVELTGALLAAAVELAEALLGRELTISADPGWDAVRRALDLVPSGRPVTARLHPADLAAAAATLATFDPATLGREIELVADPHVERGGAVVDCDATRVDAQLRAALARVREALR